jgi:hypothetical protein
VRKADNLTATCELNVWKIWDRRHHTTCGLPLPVTGTALRLTTKNVTEIVELGIADMPKQDQQRPGNRR